MKISYETWSGSGGLKEVAQANNLAVFRNNEGATWYVFAVDGNVLHDTHVVKDGGADELDLEATISQFSGRPVNKVVITDGETNPINLATQDGYLSNLMVAVATEDFAPFSIIAQEGQKTTLIIDGAGNLASRGQALTDEESFREDFCCPLEDLDPSWSIDQIGEGTDYDVSDSYMSICSGTLSGSKIILTREADYSPFYCNILANISQRITNQIIIIGFENTTGFESQHTHIIIDGINDRVVKFVTQSGDNSKEITSCTLPFGWTSDQFLLYQIEVNTNYCSFAVDDNILAVHKKHIPIPYSTMSFVVSVENFQQLEEETVVHLDMVHYENHNQLQISSGFIGEPLPVRITEDVHTINSCFTTTSTDSDQVIMEYEVPSNRTAYILGWNLTVSGSGVNASPFKMGRNDMTDEPEAPGIIDGNIFRLMYMKNQDELGADYSSCPRLWGKDGDILKATVTPSLSEVTTWRFSADLILR